MNKRRKYFVDYLCHLCLGNDESIFDIFESDEDGILLSEKLEAISGIQASPENEFPKFVCKSCSRRLTDCYEFRKICISTIETLSNDNSNLEVREFDNENYFPDAFYFVEVDEDIHKEFGIKCDFETNNYLYCEDDVPEEEKVTDDVKEENVDSNEYNVANILPEENQRMSSETEDAVKEEVCNNNVIKDDISENIKNYSDDSEFDDSADNSSDEIIKDENNSKTEQHICKFCNKVFISDLRVRIHIKRVHKQIYLADCKMICPRCGKRFKHSRDLKLHMVSHNKDSYFACNFCEKKFYSKKSWRKHIKVHAGEQNEICKICNKTILSNIFFIYHMDWHRMRQALKDGNFYSCQTCDVNFGQLEDLERHSIEKHTLKIPTEHEYIRDESKTDNIKQELIEEISIQTVDVRKSKYKFQNINASATFRCNLCNRYFKNLLNVKPHVTDCYNKMERPKTHMCDICGKRFTSAWALTNHKRGHSDAKTYICDTCGQSFKWHNDLTNHKNRIHNQFRPYVCKLCGKRCGTSATLKSHMRLHTGEKPYHCHVCNVSFSQNSSLKEHMFKHTGSKEEICSICNKIFKTPLRLKTHLKRHNLYRTRYPCDVCGRQFTEKNSVRKHKHKIHQVS